MLASVMVPRPKGKVILLLAVLSFAPACLSPARGQAVPTVAGPAGVYTITVHGPATIEHGPGYLTIRWGDTPGPAPAPAPAPSPTPTPTPPPVPPPAPKNDGPLWLSLILPTEPSVQHAAIRELFVGNDWGKDVGTRAYLSGQPALDRLGLTEATANVKPPCLVIQARRDSGETWPVVSVVPVASFEDIAKAIKAVRP